MQVHPQLVNNIPYFLTWKPNYYFLLIPSCINVRIARLSQLNFSTIQRGYKLFQKPIRPRYPCVSGVLIMVSSPDILGITITVTFGIICQPTTQMSIFSKTSSSKTHQSRSIVTSKLHRIKC